MSFKVDFNFKHSLINFHLENTKFNEDALIDQVKIRKNQVRQNKKIDKYLNQEIDNTHNQIYFILLFIYFFLKRNFSFLIIFFHYFLALIFISWSLDFIYFY